MKKRNKRLDVLRIIAASLVFLYHWSGNGPRGFYSELPNKFPILNIPNWAAPITKTGFIGVDIFFLLSGVVIASSAINSNVKDFAKSRFLRLYPTYLIANLLAITIVPIVKPNISRSHLLFSLTGLHFFAGGEQVIGALWTLQQEVFFYSIVAMSITILSKGKTFDEIALKKVLTIWTIIIVYIPVLQLKSLNNFIPGYCSYFIIGSLISITRNKKELKNNLILICVSSSLAIRQIGGRMENAVNLPHAQLIGISILLVTILYLFLANRNQMGGRIGKNRKYLTLIANATYPFYLLHETIGETFIQILWRHGVSINTSYLLVFLGIIALSIFITWKIEPLIKKLLSCFFLNSSSSNAASQ